MGFKAWVAELSTRFCRARKMQNELVEGVAPWSPSSAERSPQDMERLFLEDMVQVCSELTTKARMDFGIVGQDLQVFKYAGEGLDIHEFVPTESPLSGAFRQPASPATPSTDATIEVRGESTSPVQSPPRAFQSPPSYKRRVRETHSVPNSLASQGTPIQTTNSDLQQHLSPRVLHRNDFDPIKHLGKGCFGDVWLVFDTVSKRHLAMKIINKANKAADVYGLIFEEQRIGRDVVGSKWLLPVEGSFEDEENFYTLMEFAPGGDLYTRVHDYGFLSERALALVLPEMVLAVEEMHKQGRIHRDLKLDNFLFDSEGHIRLADFGISKAFNVPPEARPWKTISPSSSLESRLDGSKLTMTLAGTPGYIAPEVSSGKMYGFSADIFSLGVAFYKLIVGRLPFGVHCAMSVSQVAARVATSPLDFPPHVSSCTRHLLNMMLDKDPTTRISLREVKAHPYFDTVEWRHVRFQKNSQERRDEVFRGTLPQYIRRGSNLDRFPRGDVRTKITHPWFWYTGPGLQPLPSIELRPTSPLRVRKQPSSYGLREMADGQKVGRVGNQGRPRYRHARSMTTDDMKARRAAVFYE